MSHWEFIALMIAVLGGWVSLNRSLDRLDRSVDRFSDHLNTAIGGLKDSLNRGIDNGRS